VAHGSEPAAAPAAPPPERRVLVVLAGAADPASDATPLADAERTALDRIARLGRAGVADLGARSPWEGFAALLGMAEPRPSLGAAEALGLALDVADGECAYRADFVTLVDGEVRDPFGGKVKDPEAEALLGAVRAARPGTRIVRAGGHRNLVVLPGPSEFCPSPWEMVGQRAATWLPPGGAVAAFHALSAAALADHDVNHVRVDLGENPANALWLHGGGPAAAPRAERSGRATLVGRGPGVEGAARCLGWA
jgi:2,3-bisphosphoglycerate-independent phosphoglycerate mutase